MISSYSSKTLQALDFSSGRAVKNLPANAGDTGSIPGLGRLPMLRSTKSLATTTESTHTATTEAHIRLSLCETTETTHHNY